MKNLKVTKKLVVLMASLMIIASFAGCSSGAKSANMPVGGADQHASYAKSGDWGNLSDSVDYEPAETNAAEGYDEDSRDAGNSSAPAPGGGADTLTERKLIRTCGMTAQTVKFDEVVASFKAKVHELGGYFESSTVQGTGMNDQLRTGTFVARVPQDKMDALIESVSGGVTVVSSTESSEDRTLQYVDMEARIKSLKTEQQTLLDLLSKAESLESIITLQNRLSDIRYEIESYESQIKAIDNKVTYSTLNITIREVVEEEEQQEIKKRTFLDDMKDAMEEMMENVVEFGKGVVILFIMLLPLTVILLIGGVIAIIIVKRAKKKKAAKKAAAAAAAESAVPESKDKEDSKE